MNWFDKLFGRKSKDESNEAGYDLEIAKYDVEVVSLVRIPHLSVQNLMVTTFDLSVTQLKSPSYDEIEKDEQGKDVRKQFPEIVFYLKIPSQLENSKLEPISLVNALLPGDHILASRCIPVDAENIIGKFAGKKFFKKLVYELVVLTPDTLLKLNMQYLEYRKEVETIKKKSIADIAKMQEDFRVSLENMEKPYLDKEKKLREGMERLTAENFDLTFNIPAKRNSLLKNAIKKMNLL